jgi:glycosyltransferase involved in cell wall biosynthesis
MHRQRPPKISVIVPCFKQAQFVGQAIASVQAQTFSDWELIVVDDGSPDNVAEVTEKLALTDHRVNLLRKPNGGLSSARNAGLRAANGQYIQGSS